MTPTKQDKELLENSFGEWLENHGVELIGNNPSHLGTWQAMVDMNELKLAIMQLIAADRKRVELEARKGQTFKVIQSLVKSGSISDGSASRALMLFDAELKAQQEEV